MDLLTEAVGVKSVAVEDFSYEVTAYSKVFLHEAYYLYDKLCTSIYVLQI